MRANAGPKVPFPNRKQTILLIDDSEDMLVLGQTVLKLDGFEVLVANGGHRALDILSEKPQVDLILLDIQMENMSGSEFLEVLAKQRPDIDQTKSVVFCSATNSPPKVACAGFLRKDGNMTTFLDSVRNLLLKNAKTS
jgi:CheY-like chemotaxis protein